MITSWAPVASMFLALVDGSLAARVEAMVAPRIARGDSVGIVVGFVADGRARVFGFGRPSVADDEPPDGRTVFEIGSITKVFTAIALADLAREGLVGLDDPVARLLPEGVRVPDHDGRPITLRSLAEHSSGLPVVIPKVVGLGIDPYADVTAADLYDAFRTMALSRDPGAKYAYSNLGAGLLGLALARRAGTDYDGLIRARVCGPLGMRDTGVALDPGQRLRLARPYKEGGAPSAPWTFDAFAGAGALHSTADDLLRFARANLGEGDAPDRLRAAMDEARRPRTRAGGDRMSIGLGWHVFERRGTKSGREIAWHNGGTGGYRSFLAVDREARAAVVVLSNSDAPIDDLGLALIDRRGPGSSPAKAGQPPGSGR